MGQSRGTYHQLFEDLHSHPKTFDLAARLEEIMPALRSVPGIARDMVVAQLHRIGCWCCRESETGRVGHLPAITFAQVMQWPDLMTAEQFRDAWHESGFIADGGTSDASLHEWELYASRLIQDRIRKRASKAKESAPVPGNDARDSRNGADQFQEKDVTSRARVGRRKTEDGRRNVEDPPTPRTDGDPSDVADATGGEEAKAESVDSKAAQKAQEARQRGEQAQEVFEHWTGSTGRTGRTTFKGKRRNRVLDRLKEGWSPGELCRAIDGCLQSPHHRGENERGTVYDDLELICRDSEHVEKFIRFAEGQGLRTPVGPMTKADRQHAEIAAGMRSIAAKWDAQHGTGFQGQFLEGRQTG